MPFYLLVISGCIFGGLIFLFWKLNRYASDDVSMDEILSGIRFEGSEREALIQEWERKRQEDRAALIRMLEDTGTRVEVGGKWYRVKGGEVVPARKGGARGHFGGNGRQLELGD